MTGQRFQRRNHGGGHSYSLDGQRVPGVTTILGTLNKDALVGWAAKQSAAYAVENWDRLSRIDVLTRATEIERARFATNRKATTKGNRIHALGDELAHGRAVDVPVEIQPQVEAYAKFLDMWDLETIATETPVCHSGYQYAGTFDLIARSDKLGTVLCDIKTGKGVYSETALQLAAYRYADLRLEQAVEVGPRGGRKVSWVERPAIEVDHAVVFHVTDDAVELVPLVTTPSVFTSFLYLLEVYVTWIERTNWKNKDDEKFAPVVGNALWPESPDLAEVLNAIEEEEPEND